MKRFIQGESRTQITLLPELIDNYITEANPVRMIEFLSMNCPSANWVSTVLIRLRRVGHLLPRRLAPGLLHRRLQPRQKKACDELFAMMSEHFAPVFARHGLALSIEFSEFSEAGTWKKNIIHPRYKKT